MSPDPAPANVVMIEVSPKIVFSSLSLGPVPEFFNFDSWSVHVVHVVTISESCHLSITSKIILTELSSSDIAVDFKSSDGVCQCDDSSSPSFIEGVVGVIEWGVGRIELIERSVQLSVVDNTSDWQDFGARCVTFLGVTSFTRHSADIAVFLFWPDGGRKSESLFSTKALPVI